MYFKFIYLRLSLSPHSSFSFACRNADQTDAYRLIRSSPNKSILTNSHQSSPQKTVLIEHPLYQNHQPQSPKHLLGSSPVKCRTMTLPARKLTGTPNHHPSIRIQHGPNFVGNATIMTLGLDTSAITAGGTTANHFPCELPPPPSILVQKQVNKYYPATATIQIPVSQIAQSMPNPLFMPPAPSPQYQQQQQPSAQQQIQLIQLQQNNQQNLSNKDKCNTDHPTIQIQQQFHTATVHGKISPSLFLIFSDAQSMALWIKWDWENKLIYNFGK